MANQIAKMTSYRFSEILSQKLKWGAVEEDTIAHIHTYEYSFNILEHFNIAFSILA